MRGPEPGFTLIEVLVVLLLLGLLASVVGPAAWRSLENMLRRGEIADAEAFLRRLPERGFQEARPRRVDTATLAALPGLPGEAAQWQVRREVEFSRRGSCSGGEVAFRPSVGDAWVVFALAPLTCEPRHQDGVR